MFPQPGGGPCPARDLGSRFEEREPGAVRFIAVPAVFGPHHLQRPGNGNIAQPLVTAFLDPHSDHPAGGAPRRLVGFNDDCSCSIGSDTGGDDTVIGQVEEGGGSVGCDPGRLMQGLVVLFQVECLDTLIPAGPRALLSLTTRTQFPTNHEEPVTPNKLPTNREPHVRHVYQPKRERQSTTSHSLHRILG